MTVRTALQRLGLILALAVIIILAALHRPVLDAAGFQHAIESTGSWAPPVFVLSFALALAMVPGTLAHTWLGHAGGQAAAGSETAVRNLLLGVGLLAAVAFLPRLLRRLRSADAGRIDTGSLKHRLDHLGGSWVIDLRGAEEFNGPLGHIPAARNIPLDDLPSRLAELEAARKCPLTLVCRTDKRFAKAAALLRQAGFADVSVLRGGMENWNRRGFEVARRTDE